ncbi:glycosyltransferase involved in cell wall biosynthesis [Arthrobacter pascens]|uniref:glycosyltransferase family 4 protein n=1 Tax=Arthrobacter pascens TaxID=1677 RepID=UPI00278D1437|nr:glycosyltransferase family 4 protein [Arthrobacter pascens]MDQ0677296.1 glycosyltransferase involved in cell wall biosynthesis [Arthrobacter pascens]
MKPWFRNLRLACGVVADSLADDPFQFLLQASRRLPAELVTPAARMLAGAAPAASTAVPVLVAELLRGDNDGLKRRMELALDRGLPPGKAAKLADIALAADDPVRADQFLTVSSGGRGHAAAQARRFWFGGAVNEAIAALDGERGPVPKNGGQLARLVSEQSLLRGWAPQLPATRMEPVPNRVLHLLTNSLPHTQSGYARRSQSILMAQQDAGWETLAVTRLGYPVLVGKLGANLQDRVDGVRYQRLLPARLAATPAGRLQQQAEETLRLALEFRPSVIHTTTHYVNGLVARAVAEALGIPWVYEVRGQLADTWASTRGPEAKESQRYKLFQERESEVMRSADLVVTLGETMKGNILATGVQEGKIIVAPNAVGGDYLREPLGVREARQQLGLEQDAQIIGTVSSLVPYEGLDDLVAAFALLAPSNPKLRLLIVGSGVSLPSLQDQARRTGFGDRVIFTGLVPSDQARAYHQALDIFVVPRKNLDVTRSVTPLKPVEALASGRPVVASALPALAEIVDDGSTGLLVPPEDPAALAQSLASLLADAPLRDAMGQSGRQRVLRTRTWDANAAVCVQAYRAAAAGRSRRSR